MITTKEFSYIGVGQVFIGGRPAGNCSLGNLRQQEETRDLRDYQNPGGGLANSIPRIQSVEFALTMRDFVAENWALSTSGSHSNVAAGSAVDEPHTAKLGHLIRLTHMDPADLVVVDAATELVTYDLGTDYEVSAAGIVPLASGAISEDEDLFVSYDYSARRVIEALTQSGQEYEVTVAGLNEAQSGKPVVIDIWRWKPGPAQEVPLIGDDFGEQAVAGRILRDTSKGAGVSGYYRVSQVEA
jgi:hypothetical protein